MSAKKGTIKMMKSHFVIGQLPYPSLTRYTVVIYRSSKSAEEESVVEKRGVKTCKDLDTDESIRAKEEVL